MSLPLKAKVAIRDFWDKDDSAVVKARAELRTILGLEIRCEPDWPILIAGLESVYDDKGQIVKIIIDCIALWFQNLADVLDNPANEEFAEKLIDRIRESSARLLLVVGIAERDIMLTSWDKASTGFSLLIPKKQIYNANEYHSIMQDQILASLDEDKGKSKSLPIISTTGDDWADVAADEIPAKAPVSRPASSIAVPEYLPDPRALPQPSTLFAQPPYHLLIHVLGNNKIQLECNHSPTLEVLSEYLKRWCRTNPNMTNKPPILSIELNHSSSCFGSYDFLTIFSENRYGGIYMVSATTILSLVETLGYEKVAGETSSWHYRRTTAFKK